MDAMEQYELGRVEQYARWNGERGGQATARTALAGCEIVMSEAEIVIS